MKKRKQAQKQLAEIRKCKADFLYFARTYLRIIDKNGKRQPLKLNPAQEKIWNALRDHDKVMVLKSRQLGSSTLIAAVFFWEALFNANRRVAVVAHTGEAVKNIFRIYQTFWQNLPKWLQMKREAANANEMVFAHGARIKIGSAKSESFRGATYDCIHASEYAFWSDIKQSIASLFQTAQGGSRILLESTPNGLNDAYRLWNEDTGFERVFLSWLDDPGYVADWAPDDLTQRERDYIAFNKLDKRRSAWAVTTLRTQCANNWNTFNQEYPISVDVAFITSGHRVFDLVYPDVTLREGAIEFEPPGKYRTYIMGVDTASGSPGGDYSAFVILDATDRKQLRTVASFYDRVKPSAFTEIVLAAAKRYNAFCVIENNSYGLSVLEGLRNAEWAHLFRRVKYDKLSKRWQENLGFNTNGQTRPLMLAKLEEWVNKKWLLPRCPRFQLEINTFVYNSRGKAEHDAGQHDDMLFAHALALMGLDQLSDYEREVQMKHKPRNQREILEWELRTGKLWKHHKAEFWDEGDDDWADDHAKFLRNTFDG